MTLKEVAVKNLKRCTVDILKKIYGQNNWNFGEILADIIYGKLDSVLDFALVDIFALFILFVLGDDYQKTYLYGSQRFILCFKFFSSPLHFQLMVLNLDRFVEPVFPAAFFV